MKRIMNILSMKIIEYMNLIEQFPNVIVLRTFSKAYGLAAFRVGYGN